MTRTPPQATDQLKITAQLENTDQLTEVDLHEPAGPSIVDLPTPGLLGDAAPVGAHTDTIALRYQAG